MRPGESEHGDDDPQYVAGVARLEELDNKPGCQDEQRDVEGCRDGPAHRMPSF